MSVMVTHQSYSNSGRALRDILDNKQFSRQFLLQLSLELSPRVCACRTVGGNAFLKILFLWIVRFTPLLFPYEKMSGIWSHKKYAKNLQSSNPSEHLHYKQSTLKNLF